MMRGHPTSGKYGYRNREPSSYDDHQRTLSFMEHPISGRAGNDCMEALPSGSPSIHALILPAMAHSTSGRDGFQFQTLSDTSQQPSGHLNTGVIGNTALHSSVSCDHCGQKDFPGIRYKCSTCPDYDLCETCITHVEKSLLHPHMFIRIPRPLRISAALPPFLSSRSDWIHHVPCAGCSAQNIVGYRYFCTVCGESLCEACEQCALHNASHTLLKMRPPPNHLA